LAPQGKEPAFDELTLIDGIDSTIERVLNNIGVKRYAGLAATTPEFIAAELQRVNIRISAQAIAEQDWIGRARQLVEEQRNAASKGDEHIDARATKASQLFDAGQLEQPEVAEDPGDSSLLGQQDRQSAATAVTAGAEGTDNPADFRDARREESLMHTANASITMQSASERLEEPAAIPMPASAAPPAAPPPASAPVPPNMELHIRRAHFAQKNLSSTTARGDKVLHGEIGCELLHLDRLPPASETMVICAEVHAVDLANGRSELLASKSQIVQPHRNDYSTAIDVKIPPSGKYRLQVVAFLLGGLPLFDLYRGPVLRVES
jgi:hypothetical protein